MCHVNFQKRKKKELMQKFYENNNNNRDIISGKNLTTIIFNRVFVTKVSFFGKGFVGSLKVLQAL
jgi:hypothetical protein